MNSPTWIKTAVNNRGLEERDMTRSLFPCGVTRREFVWEMGGGFVGLALASLLAEEGFFARHAAAAQKAAGPLAPRSPHFAAKAKSVIFLMMNGAPSHIDTFDYKPSLAKYAGQELPPSFQYTNSGGRKKGFLTPAWRPFRPGGKSGLMVSDYFPRVREHADKLALTALNSPYGAAVYQDRSVLAERPSPVSDRKLRGP
jgi:hypothetical protein